MIVSLAWTRRRHDFDMACVSYFSNQGSACFYFQEWLAWAIDQENGSVRGGILADEMGMGKTIQVSGGTQGPHLKLEVSPNKQGDLKPPS
jgi:hypothetical protein